MAQPEQLSLWDAARYSPAVIRKRVTEVDAVVSMRIGRTVTHESERTIWNKFDPDVFKRNQNRTVIYEHYATPHIYCRVCSELKPATPYYFPVDSRNTGSFGLDRRCHQCERVRRRARYQPTGNPVGRPKNVVP